MPGQGCEKAAASTTSRAAPAGPPEQLACDREQDRGPIKQAWMTIASHRPALPPARLVREISGTARKSPSGRASTKPVGYLHIRVGVGEQERKSVVDRRKQQRGTPAHKQPAIRASPAQSSQAFPARLARSRAVPLERAGDHRPDAQQGGKRDRVRSAIEAEIMGDGQRAQQPDERDQRGWRRRSISQATGTMSSSEL